MLAAALSKKGSVKVWYPAAGYRYAGTGALSYVGNAGYSWSSTVSSTNANYLDFYYAILCPSSVDGRAHGLQVRCLRE